MTTAAAYINGLCAMVAVGISVSIFGLVLAVLCDVKGF